MKVDTRDSRWTLLHSRAWFSGKDSALGKNVSCYVLKTFPSRIPLSTFSSLPLKRSLNRYFHGSGPDQVCNHVLELLKHFLQFHTVLRSRRRVRRLLGRRGERAKSVGAVVTRAGAAEAVQWISIGPRPPFWRYQVHAPRASASRGVKGGPIRFSQGFSHSISLQVPWSWHSFFNRVHNVYGLWTASTSCVFANARRTTYFAIFYIFFRVIYITVGCTKNSCAKPCIWVYVFNLCITSNSL